MTTGWQSPVYLQVMYPPPPKVTMTPSGIRLNLFRVTDIHLATYCIICGRKSSNRDQAQSGRYTELQDALNKQKQVGTLEFSCSKMLFSTF